MTKPRLYTLFDGRRTSIRDLARTPSAIENGITYRIIYKRHQLGLSGHDLIAPQPKKRHAKKTNSDETARRELVELRRQFRDRQAERKERYITALIKAREAHEREFSRPLIDRKLLTDEERWQHRFMVRGVQRWVPMGGWRGQ